MDDEFIRIPLDFVESAKDIELKLRDYYLRVFFSVRNSNFNSQRILGEFDAFSKSLLPPESPPFLRAHAERVYLLFLHSLSHTRLEYDKSFVADIIDRLGIVGFNSPGDWAMIQLELAEQLIVDGEETKALSILSEVSSKLTALQRRITYSLQSAEKLRLGFKSATVPKEPNSETNDDDGSKH